MGLSVNHSKHVGSVRLPFTEQVVVSVVREATMNENLTKIESRYLRHILVTIGRRTEKEYKIDVDTVRAWRDVLDKAIIEAGSVPYGTGGELDIQPLAEWEKELLDGDQETA